MRSLRQLLDQKKGEIVALTSADSVKTALELLNRHDIGALLVMEGGRLAGILSERDLVRKAALVGDDRPVRELMSGKVVYVTLSNTAEECMALMTERRFRHLPVLDEAGKVVGVVSIGDMVKEVIRDQAFTIEQLTQYITG